MGGDPVDSAIPTRLAVHLVEGILQPLVADTAWARRRFPEVEPLSYRRSVELALERIALKEVNYPTAKVGARHAVPLQGRLTTAHRPKRRYSGCGYSWQR